MSKSLYSFNIFKTVEVEEDKTETVTNEQGEKVVRTYKEKVKKQIPIEINILQPNRKQMQEADMEFSIEMSRCIRNGILTKAMLLNKYSDTGGLMSEDDAKDLVDNYKKIFELQSEYSRLEIIQNKNEKQTERVSEIAGELANVRRQIVETESNYQALFDHTADVKAQNRLILWYVIMLTYIQESEEDTPKPYFGVGSFDDKLEEYYKKEESDDSIYFLIAKKAATILAFWFFNQASDKDSFDDLMKRLENNEI